ncbi:hypothetical protein HV336_11785 [Citrobacter freundii]|uniref:Uncharacterized protein n=1 Tax=Citrobacter portucalensis TaxID=1639133 RepID=A0A9X4GGS8_9ENTR|nr:MULTISPECIES: hypothetical protein [Citrobacter freundii complex]MDE9616656.1 hypothetical protein [Citrobacter portucalensis]QLR77522.1 hypothetical protein HV336_11785 [Citrobacter freundii]
MTDRISSCPICKQKLKVETKTGGDWALYRCDEHGQFKLSNTLSVILVRKPEMTAKVEQYLLKPRNEDHVICTYDVGI